MFIIFFNDLNYLKISSKLFQYADDTTVTFACDSIVDLVRVLASDLNQIAVWLHHNHLLLNVSKTQAINFAISNRGVKREHPPELEIDGIKIKYIDQITQLGVTFDRFLKGL